MPFAQCLLPLSSSNPLRASEMDGASITTPFIEVKTETRGTDSDLLSLKGQDLLPLDPPPRSGFPPSHCHPCPPLIPTKQPGWGASSMPSPEH